MTCYVLINPWPRRQHQGKHADRDCFALQTKWKKAFGFSCQLPDLTITRHKRSAMLLKRPTITLVNYYVMLRINDWRDISGFTSDYQKNTKWDWQALLPLLPSTKGQSLLTHHIRKLLLAFITSSFTWTSFFNKRSSDNVWNFRELEQKSSLWSVLTFCVKTGHRISYYFSLEPKTSGWLKHCVLPGKAPGPYARILCNRKSTTSLDKLFLFNCIIRKLHLISSLNWSSFSFQPWESP